MRWLALLLPVTLLGCSDDDPPPPADFAGSYTMSVTNGANGCEYDNWKEGENSQGVQFDITQNGTAATATPKGVVAVLFGIWGIGPLQGSVTGLNASMTAPGSTPLRKNACTFTLRATANLTLSGNAVNGNVTYTNETNKHPDCGILDTCNTVQNLAGSRPPK